MFELRWRSYLLDTPECRPRRIACPSGAPAANFFEKLQMRVDFSREVGVGPACSKKCDES
jgi:hypothetical protein